MTDTKLEGWQPDAALGAEAIEKLLISGDLRPLTPAERVRYYLGVCHSLELNPTTQPFQYIEFDGRLTLYARRDCTDQLRKRDTISTRILDSTITNEVLIVRAVASTPAGRSEDATGAVSVKGLFGVRLANAYMTAETKAKRRATLSICGLGFLDESEIDTIPAAAIPRDPTGNLGPTANPAAPPRGADPAGQRIAEDHRPVLLSAIAELGDQARTWLFGVAKADQIPNVRGPRFTVTHRDRLAWHILVAQRDGDAGGDAEAPIDAATADGEPVPPCVYDDTEPA